LPLVERDQLREEEVGLVVITAELNLRRIE
jgi:hypothetical protein